MENYSCIIRNNGVTRIFRRRGVADLFEVLRREPELLRGADVTDKVVGKGAAALMALGGIAVLHTPVISRPALRLLQANGIRAEYGVLADRIMNRAGTGQCPLERLCEGTDSLDELLEIITSFIENL